jgi:hypothetical protein
MRKRTENFELLKGNKMGNSAPTTELSEDEQRNILDFDVSVKAIADKIKALNEEGKSGVVVMCGAGISVSAGIPGVSV